MENHEMLTLKKTWSLFAPAVELSAVAPGARRRFRETHGLGEGPVLLSVGWLTTRKGLREFVGDVLPRIAAAKNAGVEKNLRFLSKRFGAELGDAYAGADLHVFPVRQIPSDPEGFGMVAVEAATSGLVTVAYAMGEIADAVSEGESGSLIGPGNAIGFAEAVCTSPRNPLSSTQIRCFAAHGPVSVKNSFGRSWI
jgi:phosphatidylinositol alpha-1,6-mannosyltransferase